MAKNRRSKIFPALPAIHFAANANSPATLMCAGSNKRVCDATFVGKAQRKISRRLKYTGTNLNLHLQSFYASCIQYPLQLAAIPHRSIAAVLKQLLSSATEREDIDELT